MKVDENEVRRRLGHFEAVVRAAGVRLTHQRLEVFREVAGSLDHPDAEAVFRAVRKRLRTVSLDTVYRTLRLLEDLGVLGTLGPRRESMRFDANLASHHHYVCLRCGLVRDFESADMSALPIPAEVREVGEVHGTFVEVRGFCRACEGKRQEESTAKHQKRPKGQERRRTWRRRSGS
ncbi:MAG: transcriptional repressor [Planctomycetes bacterium]|jgi:Fur family peroxide stress response transcriptional regulator|nr:transcriptional repressor [Planctomycetota bacterium]